MTIISARKIDLGWGITFGETKLLVFQEPIQLIAFLNEDSDDLLSGVDKEIEIVNAELK